MSLRIPFWLGAALTVLTAIALIWLPFGFRMTALVEEWGILNTFIRNGDITWLALQGGPFATHAVRPLTMAPFALAYWLSPASFVPWHGLQALTLVLKAVGMGFLVLWAFRNRWAALAMGLLFVVYPADTMQMALRNMHSNWAVALTVCGLAAVMWCTEARGAARVLLALLGSLSFAVGALIYEGGILLTPAPLLFWWARYGWVGLRRLPAQWPVALLWLICVAGVVANAIFVIRAGGSYQTAVVGEGIVGTVISQMPLLFTVGLYRTFLHGWYDGWRMLASNVQLVWPALLAVLAGLAAVCGACQRQAVGERQANIRWLVAGFLTAILGYLPYLTSYLHTSITQRTFLFAPIGAVLVVAVAVVWVMARSRLGALALLACLFAAGYGAQWEQMRFYGELSSRQASLLSSIMRAVPDVKPGATIVIEDESGQLAYDWMLNGELTRSALTDLYGFPVETYTCAVPSMRTVSYGRDANGDAGGCSVRNGIWTFGAGTVFERQLPAGSTVVRINSAGLASPPSGAPLAALTDRARSMLGCQDCTYTPPRADRYGFEFGRFWSMDDPPRGFGWSGPQWTAPGLSPDGFAWEMRPDPQLWFDLAPVDGPYDLRVQFVGSPPAGLALLVNGKSVDFELGDSTAQGVIGEGTLVDGQNLLTIRTERPAGVNAWSPVSGFMVQPR